MAGIGLWVDSSDQTPEETVNSILAGLGLGGRIQGGRTDAE
jgi:hypothetical protein